MHKNTSFDRTGDTTGDTTRESLDAAAALPVSRRSLASTLAALWATMRPRQWMKNIFVFTALAFSADRLWRFWLDPVPFLLTLAAFAVFCMAASAIYLLNDLVDIEKDRAHPRKRHRPLPSGRLSPALAIAASIALVVVALPLAYLLSPVFLAVVLTYVLVQGVLYSYLLKNIVILDILTIAAGFILRAVAGATVLHIPITPWLLVCMGLLAVFLGIGKRRHELVLLEDGAGEHRRILKEYSLPMLDQMMSIVTASVIMAYSMTTFSAPAVPQKPFPVLMSTIPFVVYGIFRYLYLIYKQEGGGTPEELLLKDRPMAFNFLLWGITVLVLLFFFGTG